MKLWRAIGVVLLALMPLQFAYFYFDYFTGYRVRSSGWFEHNLRGGLEEIIASDRDRRVPAVYLNSDIPWVDWYWPFYAIKHDQRELLKRTVYIDPKRRDVREIPKGSVFLTTVAHATQDAVLKSSEFRKTKSITDPDGTGAFFVVRTLKRVLLSTPCLSMGHAISSHWNPMGEPMPQPAPEILRGTFDLLILRALSWGPAHGYAIARWIEQATSDILAVGEGTLYPALHRLEERGWIDASWGVSENNRQAKFYSLTKRGRTQLNVETANWRRYAAAVFAALEAQPSSSGG